MQMISEAFQLLSVLMLRKGQELREETLHLALTIANVIKPQLMESGIVDEIEKLHEWAIEVAREEPSARCRELATAAVALFHARMKQLTSNIPKS